ncbi:MAG: Ppx/GppA phosphatase family protein [Pseudomonadota bacterium]
MTNSQRTGGDRPRGAQPKGDAHRRRGRRGPPPRYAALDLGTNNCRLLIAAPRGRHLRIVDAYSKIVRLGENLSHTGVLSDAAMARTIEVLKTCQRKIKQRGVTHMRCVATQACRGARNGDAFLARAAAQSGITLEIIGPEEEARLAMLGCRDLFDPAAKMVLVFDIGGGSTEIAWVRITPSAEAGALPQSDIVTWTSLPFGVVSLAEKWDGREISRETYETIVDDVRAAIADVPDTHGLKSIFQAGHGHFLGTSGTVTSLAGVHLALERYRRVDVDGLWLSRTLVGDTSERLRAMSFDERAREPCIGAERADLVVCGCAILEAILTEWPAERIRVADRGLREGILSELSGGRRMASPGAQKKRRRADPVGL